MDVGVLRRHSGNVKKGQHPGQAVVFGHGRAVSSAGAQDKHRVCGADVLCGDFCGCLVVPRCGWLDGKFEQLDAKFASSNSSTPNSKASSNSSTPRSNAGSNVRRQVRTQVRKAPPENRRSRRRTAFGHQRSASWPGIVGQTPGGGREPCARHTAVRPSRKPGGARFLTYPSFVPICRGIALAGRIAA